ncbi:STY0301 family protein [Paraherbaspirillum soli]|uniref:STY0301 family protein n=1 Tax=Paraherbaspirillum soli TaxID=631222 RepID=A0ABW0M3V0_9BURK
MSKIINIALYLSFFPYAALVNAETLSCPAEIELDMTSIKMTSQLDQWKPFFQNGKLALVAAGFSDGPAEEQAFLKPYSNAESKVGSRVTWKFEGGYPKGKWLNCDYEGNIALLSKVIPEKTKECIVSYKEKKLLAINCR